MQHRTAFLLVVLAVLAVLAVPGRTQTTEDSPDELRWTTVRKYVGGTRTVTSRRYIPGTSVRRAHVGRTFVPSNTNTRRLTYKRVFKQGRLVTRRQAYRAYVRSAALPTRRIYWFRDFKGGDFLTFTYSEGINARLRYYGSPFFLYSTQAPGTRPIYRCWSGVDHYYSFDPRCEGPHYRPEGLLGYISVTPGTCTAKLVRSYSPSVGHFARFNVAGLTARVEGTLGYPITCAAGAKYTTTGRYWQSGRWVSRTSYTVHTTAGRWVTVRRQVPSGRWVTQRVWRPDPKPTPTPTPTPTRVQRYYRWIGKCLYLTTTRGRYTSNRKIRCRSSQVVTGQWVTLYEGTQQIRKYLSATEVREFAAACPTFASRLRSGKL
jgi:hypothetical protein